MKIAVIGTINKDLIIPFEESPIQSIGGIYYSVSSLSQFVGNGASIVPISYLGDDLYHAILSLLNQFPNVDSSGAVCIEQKNHEVILEYISREERKERALFKFPSLEWENIKEFTGADFYIVNMITGWDISLDAFLRLSQSHFENIYLDVHFLVMGVDSMGRRYPQRPDNIRDWLRGARFVQMNEREYGIIAGGQMHEKAFFEEYLRPEQVLIITMADRGAKVIFRKEGTVRFKGFPAYSLDRFFDATGCGDVFGAAFVSEIVRGQNIYQAMEFANLAAAANCLLKGTSEMENLLLEMDKLKSVETSP